MRLYLYALSEGRFFLDSVGVRPLRFVKPQRSKEHSVFYYGFPVQIVKAAAPIETAARPKRVHGFA